MKKATTIGLLCFLLLQFLQTAVFKGVNVAYKRPVQSNLRSHHSHGSANEAVDDDKYKTCFENLKKFKAPWLQIDLGKHLWVEKVSIMTRKKLSKIDIRIGYVEANLTANPLCRTSLRIPEFISTPFSCAEPMLGRYLYIAAKKYFQLCDVQVFLNADAVDTNIKYLVSNNGNDGGMLEKGKYDLKDHSPDKVFAEIDLTNPRRTVKVARKDLVIDLPPKAESLTFKAAVLIPVKRGKDSSNDTCESKEGRSEQKYINGAVSKTRENGVVTIKARYTTPSNKEREHIFRCSKGDVRMKGDVCQLQNKCGDLKESKCDTKFISPLFPPGSYYCKCNPGFASSSSTKLPIENYVLPGEKCIKARPPQIWHSNQNLASLKKAIGSSTDNFEGCKKKNCKEKEAFARFAVDGDPKTCFRSHKENEPWMLVFLGDLQPVSLVRIHSAKSQTGKRNSGLKDLGVFVGRNSRSHFIECAVEELLVDDQETSFGCKSELYVFGNSVKITTKDRVLRLCEVEVYAYTYGNVIGRKQYSYPTNFSRLAIDGDTGTCFKAQNGRHRHPYWYLILGKNVRVALVFVLLHAKFQWKNTSIQIDGKVCTIIRAYGARKGNYFECSQPVTGTRLQITWSPAYIQYIQLCEVEVFQTKIINLAGKRPTKSSKNEKESYRGCDQKLDKPFTTEIQPPSTEIQWWSVDLIALCKIHLVRIVTALGYQPQHLKGLKVLLDAGENGFGRGRHVASLDSPTEKPVQTITLPKNVKARFVTLALRIGSLELQFREVEIYSGPLLAIDECKKPNICPRNLKCVNGKKSYACVCPNGFRKIGPNKCEEIKGCIPPCAAENSICAKSFESYKCKCPYGFDPSFGEKGILLRCQDVNECERPSFNRCGNTTTCVNARGFYNCTCRNGYNLDKKGIKFECKDIDECAVEDPCHVNASCSNTPGSYKCTCSHGLSGDGYKSCLKLPRCSASGQCKENAVCKDFKGIKLCDCREGYHFNGKMCVDMNECTLNKDICGSDSVCSNTGGSYRCNCEVGFESKKDDGKNCYDINECEKREICGDTAVCENSFGSYKCNCPAGFTFDKTQKKCVDNDECTTGHSCHSNTICTNTFGSYSCSCRPGYRSDKFYCTDIDECEEDTDDCPKFSRCKNQNGSYECHCKDGYRKASDGTCSEICHPECEENSYCQTGKCLCKRGFSLGPDLTCQAAFLGSSGVSLHSRVLFLITSVLWSLVLMWFVVLLQ